jgi:hypothetical protein
MSILNNDLKLIKIINKYIKNDEKLNIIFNYHNQKYSLEELLKPIIVILKTGTECIEKLRFSIHYYCIYKWYFF